MAVLRSTITNLMEQGLRAVFFQAIHQYPPIYSKIFNVQDSLKQTEKDQQMVGVSAWDPVNEGDNTTFEDVGQGYQTSYTHITFRKGIRITAECIEDELYGVTKKPTVALARGGWQRVEVDAANVFNNAFSATNPRGSAAADSLALISASHTLTVGGTQSNALTANADLSPSSLAEAISILETTKDEKAIQLYMPATKLVVPAQSRFLAKELLMSEYKPQSTNNDVNAFADEGLTYVVNPFIADTDSWFVLADQHQLNFNWRVRPSFFKANDVDTQDMKCIGRMRYSLGWSDWRGVTGSAGA